jgi:hypothetical protein
MQVDVLLASVGDFPAGSSKMARRTKGSRQQLF